MTSEITIKDVWDRLETIRTELTTKIEKVSTDFHNFEAGKLTQALQDIERLKAEKEAKQKMDDKEDANQEDLSLKIETLQNNQNRAIGAMTALSIISPTIVYLVLHYFKLI